ncbi:MAG: sulfite exporter TauE/SafE family protein, partial [Beijerinckiaceae bacterium]
MTFDSTTVAIIAAILLLAGFVKGVIGFGLPSISMGLLSLLMTPLQAAALLLVPNVVTNIWQAWSGPALGALAARCAPLLIGTLLGIAATEWATGGRELRWAVRLLGLTLAVYALLGIFSIRFRIAPEHRTVWGWAAGLATG